MVSKGAGWFQKRLREAVWFHGSVYEFRKGGAGWFQERLGGFRRGLLVSGKSGVFPGKAAWFQEKLRFQEVSRGFRRGCGVSRKCVSHMMLEV